MLAAWPDNPSSCFCSPAPVEDRESGAEMNESNNPTVRRERAAGWVMMV